MNFDRFRHEWWNEKPAVVSDELQQDIDDYNECQAVMAKLRKQGVAGIDSEDFQLAWAEAERIKNKHGGLPPHL